MMHHGKGLSHRQGIEECFKHLLNATQGKCYGRVVFSADGTSLINKPTNVNDVWSKDSVVIRGSQEKPHPIFPLGAMLEHLTIQ
jgi:hypothetical protein